MALPMQVAPTVEPQSNVKAFQQIDGATPDAFGAQLGAMIQQQAGQRYDQYAQQQLQDAMLDATNAEAAFGKALDDAQLSYDADLKKIMAGDPTKLSAEAQRRQEQFVKEVDAARRRAGEGLKNPVAAKRYDVRTGLYAGSAYSKIGAVTKQAVVSVTLKNAEGVLARAVREAGNVTATDANLELVTQDVNHLAAAIGLGVLPWQQARQAVGGPDHTPDAIKADTEKVEADAVHNALKGYLGNVKAMEAFLDSKLPGGMRIGFSREHPDEPSILTAAETQAWHDQIAGKKKEKTTSGLAAKWFYGGLNADNEIRRMTKDGTLAWEDVAEARAKYHALVIGAQAEKNAYEANVENSYIDDVIKNFKGNPSTAALNKDFSTRWANLPGHIKKEADRKLMTLEREDPQATANFLALLDKARTPGWADTMDPALLTREINGTGQHRAQALALVQQDKLDKEKDAVGIDRKTLLTMLDDRVRSIVDFKIRFNNLGMPDKTWADATQQQQEGYIYARLQLGQRLTAIAKSAANDPKFNAQQAAQDAMNEVLMDTKQRYERAAKLKAKDYAAQSSTFWEPAEVPGVQRQTPAIPKVTAEQYEQLPPGAMYYTDDGRGPFVK